MHCIIDLVDEEKSECHECHGVLDYPDRSCFLNRPRFLFYVSREELHRVIFKSALTFWRMHADKFDQAIWNRYKVKTSSIQNFIND